MITTFFTEGYIYVDNVLLHLKLLNKLFFIK